MEINTENVKKPGNFIEYVFDQSLNIYNQAVTDVINEYPDNGSSIHKQNIQKKHETTEKQIVAILPAYNEEVSIGSIVLRAKQHVDHVIVIDDGSSDRTVKVAEMAGAEVIRHSRNMGKGSALKTGFEAALRNGTKIIVTIDTDGQHDPEEIPQLIEPILTGEADLVNGSRYINGKEKNTPKYRRLGQMVLDKATNMNCGINITDSQSGFRAFAAHTVKAFRFKQNGFGIESEMLADASKADLKIKEVDIKVRYDVDCSTKNPISHGIGVLVKILKDIEFNRPLYYFTAPGTVAAGLGIGMGMTFIRDFYLGGSLSFGPTLMMIMLTLIGMFMAFTGIILHSMSRLIDNLMVDEKLIGSDSCLLKNSLIAKAE